MSDLISRQEAIDSWDKLSKRGRTEFDQVLMTLPSAPDSRQRGEWREDDKGYFYCDQCHKYPKYQEAKSDFCPSCGADMRKGGDPE